MQRYQKLGMQLRLKRAESGLHQKTLGLLLGGATQALISRWESGRYMPSPRYLPKSDYIGLDNRLIILPVTKNNTVRVLPINDTLCRILSEMPEKSGYVFGHGNAGTSRT
jgi:transcriptional regulator with XRE-family HTH domain